MRAAAHEARRFVLLASFSFLALAAVPLQAAGPTFTVTTPGDAKDLVIDGVCETGAGNHVCTLRAAVMEANATTDALIVIPAGTYTLSRMPDATNDASSGDLNITSSKVTIQGAGAGVTILEAASLGDRVFSVEFQATLKISGVTIQNATRHVLNQHAAVGGAVWVDSLATLDMSDCRIYNCTVSDPTIAFGGGLHLEGNSTVTLTRTVIDTCSARTATFCAGGGICSYGAHLTLDRCTITHCVADGRGGAISVEANSPVTRILASTLDNNTGTDGGAIANVIGSFVVVNSTLSDNKAKLSGGGVFAGAAGAVHLYNVTVMKNRGDSDANLTGAGGGVYSASAAAFSFQNSILAYNFATNQSAAFVNADCSGTLTSNGHNVVQFLPGNCVVNGGGYTQNDPFVYDELADNGGPTKTHELAGGGSAENLGDPLGCTDDLAAILTTDQRGVKRPIGSACDIGAVELEPVGDANGDGVVNVADVLYLINDLFAGGPGPLGRANVNQDGAVNVSDVLYLINFLFAGGPAPS